MTARCLSLQLQAIVASSLVHANHAKWSGSSCITVLFAVSLKDGDHADIAASSCSVCQRNLEVF